MNPASAAQDNGGLGSIILGATPAGGFTPSNNAQIKSIHVLDETEFDANTVGNMENLPTSTIGEGTYLFGIWDRIGIESGLVIAYYG